MAFKFYLLILKKSFCPTLKKGWIQQQIVLAKSIKNARQLAANHAEKEGKGAWMNKKYSSCIIFDLDFYNDPEYLGTHIISSYTLPAMS